MPIPTNCFPGTCNRSPYTVSAVSVSISRSVSYFTLRASLVLCTRFMLHALHNLTLSALQDLTLKSFYSRFFRCMHFVLLNKTAASAAHMSSMSTPYELYTIQGGFTINFSPMDLSASVLLATTSAYYSTPALSI